MKVVQRILASSDEEDDVTALTTVSDTVLACGSESSTIRLLDTTTSSAASSTAASPVAEYSLADYVDSSEITSLVCRNHVLYASAGASIFALDMRNLSEPLFVLEGATDEVNAIRLHENGKLLAAAADDNNVYVYDVDDATLLLSIEDQHDNLVTGVAWAPFSSSSSSSPVSNVYQLASAGMDMRVNSYSFSWSANSESEEETTEVQMGLSRTTVGRPDGFLCPPLIHCLDSSASGRWLATGCADGSLQLFPWLTSKHQQSIVDRDSHRAGIGSLAFVRSSSSLLSSGSDESLLMTCGQDTCLGLWRLKEDDCSLECIEQQSTRDWEDGNGKICWNVTPHASQSHLMYVSQDAAILTVDISQQ
jgi:WD40 repeat protein